MKRSGDKPETHNYISLKKDLHLSRDGPSASLNQSFLENMTEVRCDRREGSHINALSSFHSQAYDYDQIKALRSE